MALFICFIVNFIPCMCRWSMAGLLLVHPALRRVCWSCGSLTFILSSTGQEYLLHVTIIGGLEHTGSLFLSRYSGPLLFMFQWNLRSSLPNIKTSASIITSSCWAGIILHISVIGSAPKEAVVHLLPFWSKSWSDKLQFLASISSVMFIVCCLLLSSSTFSVIPCCYQLWSCELLVIVWSLISDDWNVILQFFWKNLEEIVGWSSN